MSSVMSGARKGKLKSTPSSRRETLRYKTSAYQAWLKSTPSSRRETTEVLDTLRKEGLNPLPPRGGRPADPQGRGASEA